MQRNLYMLSSMKSTDMWIALTGHSRKDVKSLRMSKLCFLWGHYNASAISQQTKSSLTRPGWTSTALNKSTEWTILRHMHPLWHGLPSDFWSSLALFLMSPLTSRCCYGVSSSSNWDGHLHGTATEDPDSTWEFQEPCVEVGKEHIWPETGWTCLEVIPCGQAHAHRICTVSNRWLHVLLQRHHIHDTWMMVSFYSVMTSNFKMSSERF